MFYKKIAVAFTLSLVSFLSSVVHAEKIDVSAIVKDWDMPSLNSISTVLPKQMVKEITTSPYIFITENDFNRDGKNEQIIGANCIEGFCINFIFKILKNNRYQYLGYAAFHQKYYELVWSEKSSMPAIIYFEQTNVGQGCMGRYEYEKNIGYKRVEETCRLPKEVIGVISTHANKISEEERSEENTPTTKERNLDFIDMSDISYDDKPEDFFPETKK